MKRRWKILPEVPRETLDSLQEFPPLVAQLLYNRGITNPSQARQFFAADESLEDSPLLLPDVEKATARIQAALQSKEAIAIYPGAGDIGAAVLQHCPRSLIFGGTPTVEQYKGNPRVQAHGPGFSKILLCDDKVDEWEKYLDIMVDSVFVNSGRGCINCSGIWASRHTKEIAQAIARSGAYAVIGGGESAAAAYKISVAEKISHISTGGGASLEFITNGTLPGIEVLKES